jgi:hypothetical protein
MPEGGLWANSLECEGDMVGLSSIRMRPAAEDRPWAEAELIGRAGAGPPGTRCLLIDLTSTSSWLAISIDMPQKSGTRWTQSVWAVKSHSVHLRALFRLRGRIMPQWQHQLGESEEIGSKRWGMR